MNEQIKQGTLSFAGLLADARKAVAAGDAQVLEDGTAMLCGRAVIAPRVADAIRFAVSEARECSMCRGVHGPEITHACE